MAQPIPTIPPPQTAAWKVVRDGRVFRVVDKTSYDKDTDTTTILPGAKQFTFTHLEDAQKDAAKRNG